jgi:pyridinium-3,5-biscarboxylic acid mononucleotide sulfurtransferase
LEKFKNLQKRLTELSSFALAFSGGADSAFLLAVAKKIKPENLIAITVSSQFVLESEIDFAKKYARSMGVQHICLDMDILEYGNIVSNTLERCYFCKKQMFALIKQTAKKYGITTLIHGVNIDDLKDFRPGLKAAEELGFLSPLVDTKITKKEVRDFSRQMGLETWDKPSQSCLATRIAYNEEITAQTLDAVDKAEIFLKMLGFVHVRVRSHGKIARIEVEPEQIAIILDKNIRQKISQQFIKLGFKNTSIDIDGYKVT